MPMSVARFVPFSLMAISTLVVTAAAGPPSGPGASWQALAVTGTRPTPRRDAAMTYDRVRNRVLLFGGRSNGTALDDSWALDLATYSWTPLATGAATGPAARFSMVQGIDAERDRWLVATGEGSRFYDDVWAFDLATNSWSQLAPSGLPPRARYGSAGGVYDPGTPGATGDTLYVSHGFTDLGRFDDTRALELATDTWRDATPPAPLPIPRCLHGGALGAARSLILFGGCGSPVKCPLDDTWRLDESTFRWSDLSQALKPAARTHPALATMGDGPFLLLFGGAAAGKQNDVWQLDSQDGTWTALMPTGTAPSGRDGASLVWIDGPDPMRGGSGCGWALMFGGTDSADRDDLWALLPATAAATPVLLAAKGGGGSGPGVELQWSHSPEASRYECWRADAPRIERGSPGLLRLGAVISVGPVSASSTDDTLDAPAPLHFYRIRTAACDGL